MNDTATLSKPASGKTKYKCISADSHLDLNWLPPTLFTDNASAAMKDRMPYVVDSPDGPLWVSKNGGRFGLACQVGSSGRKYVPGAIHRADLMAAEGLYSEESKAAHRLANPHMRVKDQDRDGVQAEVIYGILAATHFIKDPEAAYEMCRIYNEWLADFCSHYPDRLIGLAVIPGTDIDSAVAELKRVAKLGIKGVELSVAAGMHPFHDPLWEPLWAECAATKIPIHFHGAPSAFGWPAPAPHWTQKDLNVANSLQVIHAQIGASNNLTQVLMSGCLERHPDLRVILGESGIGWIPYFLDRMDYEWEDQFRDTLDLKMKPSEYWRRQCKATFQYDEVGVRLIDFLGEDTLMWASDFPHPDGVWPDSQEYIQKQFGHLPEHVRDKIIARTAVEVYGLE